MRLDEYARTICSAYIQGIAHLNDHNKGRANQYVAVLPTRRPRRFGANGEVMPYGPGAVCSAKQQVRCGPPALAVHIVMSSLLHSTGLASYPVYLVSRVLSIRHMARIHVSRTRVQVIDTRAATTVQRLWRQRRSDRLAAGWKCALAEQEANVASGPESCGCCSIQ